MKKGPDFGGEGDEGEGVLELEGPLGSLVAEEAHAQQAAGPTTNSTKQAEKGFRHARTGAGGAPFIEAEGQEGDSAPGGEPDDGELMGDFQARIFSRLLANWL